MPRSPKEERKVDWSKPLLTRLPRTPKVQQYLGPQTVWNGQPIKDNYKHLVLIGNGHTPFLVDDYGMRYYNKKRLPVIENPPEPKKKATIEEVVPSAPHLRATVNLEPITRDLNTLIVKMSTFEKHLKTLEESFILFADEVRELLKKSEETTPEPPAPVSVNDNAATVIKRIKPVAIVKDFKALTTRPLEEKELETLQKVDGKRLRESVKALMLHEKVRTVNIGTKNMARKMSATVGSIDLFMDQNDFCLKMRGYDDDGVTDLFVYYKEGARKEVLDYAALLPLERNL